MGGTRSRLAGAPSPFLLPLLRSSPLSAACRRFLLHGLGRDAACACRRPHVSEGGKAGVTDGGATPANRRPHARALREPCGGATCQGRRCGGRARRVDGIEASLVCWLPTASKRPAGPGIHTCKPAARGASSRRPPPPASRLLRWAPAGLVKASGRVGAQAAVRAPAGALVMVTLLRRSAASCLVARRPAPPQL